MTLFIGLIFGLLWGALGYLLRQRTKLSVVEVSAWLTLLAGLVLPRLFSEGTLFALICTAVSYVVMSSSERISNLWGTLVVSGVCALIIFFGQNILIGIGGRLGTSAALSVLIVVFLGSILKRGGKFERCNINN